MGEQPNGRTDGGTDDQDLVDRDKIDFDPDDGLYSGTAVDGTSEIPGPHEDASGGTDEQKDDTATPEA